MSRTLILGLVGLLLTPLSLSAAVLTVGPDGAFAELDAALDVAVSNGEDDNIRIQAGTWVVGTTASATHAEDRFLEISGGWNASFTSGVEDPAATVLSGGGTTQLIGLSVSAGQVIIRYLTLANGRAPQGAGADISVENAARLQLSDCVVRDNVVSGAAISGGGGLRINTYQSAEAEVARCHFLGNSATASVLASGGGMLAIVNDGRLRTSDLVFEDNVVETAATGAAFGGGAAFELGALDGIAELRGSRFRNNLSSGVSGSGGAGLRVVSDGQTQQLLIEGAQFIGNTDDSAAAQPAQLQVMATSGTLRLRSLALLDGIGTHGLHAAIGGSAQFLGTNLTAAGNSADGIRVEASSSAAQSLENSIAFANAGNQLSTQNSAGSFNTFLNLDSDPGVVDATSGNYRLAAGSSAINAAWPSPVAGLGTIDADGGPRVRNVSPDIGAFEYSSPDIFANGFEAP